MLVSENMAWEHCKVPSIRLPGGKSQRRTFKLLNQVLAYLQMALACHAVQHPQIHFCEKKILLLDPFQYQASFYDTFQIKEQKLIIPRKLMTNICNKQ
jgi:hypothetical protein